MIGSLPSLSEKLAILVMGVIRISTPYLSSEVGIRSRSQDLNGEDFRMSGRSSSDTSLKRTEYFLVGLGLMTKAGCDDRTFFRILSQKILQKVLSWSDLFVQSRTTTVDYNRGPLENLCLEDIAVHDPRLRMSWYVFFLIRACLSSRLLKVLK